MRRNSKKVLVVYWSSRNLGVLDNIISSLKNAGFKVKEIQFNYLQKLSLNRYFKIKSNTNFLNIVHLLVMGFKLNYNLLFYQRAYLFGTNLPLLCSLFIKRKRLICHYNEVPKFFENSDSMIAKFEKRIFKNAINIVVSNTYREQLFRTINTNANYIILDNIMPYRYYNGEIFELKKLNIPVKLLYSGSIGRTREIIRIIKAVKENHKFELTLIGDIDNSYREAFFKEIEGVSNIVYLGKVTFETVLNLTKETDFGIAIYNLTDHNNLFCAPVKIHEYFHYYKPVVSLENPSMVSIEKDFRIVFLLKEIDDLKLEKTADALKNFEINSESFRLFEMISLNNFNKSIDKIITTTFN